MDKTVVKLVSDYIKEHLDKSDEIPEFEVYIVWKCKILQNWKYLLVSTLPDGMYYELTYDGDKNRWYLDAYKKFENICITKLQEAVMWLGMDLKRIGDVNPYPNSKDPSTGNKIDPTADNLKF